MWIFLGIVVALALYALVTYSRIARLRLPPSDDELRHP
ncbi:hypothetical protein I8G32_04641 [Rhodopseudomonas palustris]|nr:hypothetical protein I8G32_04641 [Rhodopseudomonas palustris]